MTNSCCLIRRSEFCANDYSMKNAPVRRNDKKRVIIPFLFYFFALYRFHIQTDDGLRQPNTFFLYYFDMEKPFSNSSCFPCDVIVLLLVDLSIFILFFILFFSFSFIPTLMHSSISGSFYFIPFAFIQLCLRYFSIQHEYC